MYSDLLTSKMKCVFFCLASLQNSQEMRLLQSLWGLGASCILLFVLGLLRLFLFFPCTDNSFSSRSPKHSKFCLNVLGETDVVSCYTSGHKKTVVLVTGRST